MVESEKKRILVTGGNTGIGYALCKLLVTEHDCDVYMGSRSVDKGLKAIQALTTEEPRCKGRVELLQVDVADPESIIEAADTLEGRLGGKKLYGLVNNAGVMYSVSKISKEVMIQTNVYGVI